MVSLVSFNLHDAQYYDSFQVQDRDHAETHVHLHVKTPNEPSP